MSEPIIFTRDDSERLVRLEEAANYQAESLQEINSNVKALVEHIRTQNGRITKLENIEVQKKLDQTDSRITSLEETRSKQKWFVAGISSFVSFLISAAAIAFSFFGEK